MEENYERHIKATQDILDEKFKMGSISNMYIPEILEGLEAIPVFKDRVEALKKNSDRSLNTVLYYTFKNDRPLMTGNDVEEIKYTPSHAEDDISIAPMNLYDTAKRLYIFDRKDITVTHMIKLATEILENLHPLESGVFKGIFIGKMPYKNITKNLVKTAFPDLFSDEIEEEAETVTLKEDKKTVAELTKLAKSEAAAKTKADKAAATKKEK